MYVVGGFFWWFYGVGGLVWRIVVCGFYIQLVVYWCFIGNYAVGCVMDRPLTNMLFHFFISKTVGIAIINCWQKEQIYQKNVAKICCSCWKICWQKLGTRGGPNLMTWHLWSPLLPTWQWGTHHNDVANVPTAADVAGWDPLWWRGIWAPPLMTWHIVGPQLMTWQMWGPHVMTWHQGPVTAYVAVVGPTTSDVSLMVHTAADVAKAVPTCGAHFIFQKSVRNANTYLCWYRLTESLLLEPNKT